MCSKHHAKLPHSQKVPSTVTLHSKYGGVLTLRIFVLPEDKHSRSLLPLQRSLLTVVLYNPEDNEAKQKPRQQ